VKGARLALIGQTYRGDSDGEPAIKTRKKDAPDHDDAEGVRRFLAAQAEQRRLAARRQHRSGKRRSELIASASMPLPGGPLATLVWSAPKSSSTHQYALPNSTGSPRHPARRAVCDDVLSVRECGHAIGLIVVGMMGSDCSSPEYNGESTMSVHPTNALPSSLGVGAARLVSLMIWRVFTSVRRIFEENRPLYVAGALLTRLQRPPHRDDPTAGGASYAYDVAHCDRANVASYDYSAVLYLNGKGDGFRGGDFRFLDDEGDEVVEPRAGRCVMFPSGYENMHRVCAVEVGTRSALAIWFTLTPASGGRPVSPVHYEIGNPVPPLSREESEADATSIDELRAQVERMLG